MSKELQTWFKQLPMRTKRDLAAGLRDIAEELADDIRDAAPVKEGALRNSVKVRRTKHDLLLFVQAGGDETTKEIREGSGVDYDYAMAQEFGTSKMPANPFFYTTVREQEDEVNGKIADLVGKVLKNA